MKNAALTGAGGVFVAMLFVPVILHEAAERRNASVVEEQKPSTVLFVGDIMLDRSVARHVRAAGANTLFAGVKNIFVEHSLVVGNLEGTLTTNVSLAEASSSILRFTFAPTLAETLADAGFGLVSLANNHTLDFGGEGYTQTLGYLEAAGITAFGHPLNSMRLAARATVSGQTLCFVGYHELFYRDPSVVIGKIIEIEPACDHTVLFAHWGVEYEHEPSSSQRELAHLFVDSGADIVIGAHPHVVQPVEVYNKKPIFYSLGNFVFDQRWRPEVRRGAMVSAEFGDTEIKFTVVPVNTYLEATLADEETSAAVLADLGVVNASFVVEK